MEPEDSAGEKLELLQRAEVRTMAKDIAALQEQEALKEWEKIQNVQTAGSAQTNLKEPPASRLAASSAALPSGIS
ncbi:MAG: hypothetical protein HYV78_02240 [Candidatus Wildermuthbacteria bacterium]|nr:hypothetical protein [Candidatus Wildermuthbacteria bacterium]